jgi:hypothetical protein
LVINNFGVAIWVEPDVFRCTSSDGALLIQHARQLRVLLDVTIHDFPCIDLSLDYQDVTWPWLVKES